MKIAGNIFSVAIRSCATALVAIIILFACIPIATFAETETDTDGGGAVIVENDVLSYTCSYDSKSDSVTVSGSLEAAAFAEYRDHTIEIYRVPIGWSEYKAVTIDGVRPLASGEVSLRFGFNFKAESDLDKYVRYAVFLRSPEGTLLLGTEAQYPEISSNVERLEDRSGFKGVYDTDSLGAADTGADTAVIPVYLNRLFTEDSSGYIHRVGEEKLFFSKKYIDEIDARVRGCALSGARVYLHLLLESKEGFNIVHTGSSGYYMPDVYDLSTVVRLYAAVEFLSLRYGAQGEDELDGFIVGKAWRYNYTANMSFDDFADHCAAYVALVANCARGTDPSLDVVMSLSGANFSGVDKSESYSTKQLMEKIFAYFNMSFSSGLDCSLMIETPEIPFGITGENLSNGIDISYKSDTAGTYAGGQSVVSDWLDVLSSKYSGVPSDYIFSWDPPQSLKDNALTAAYVYSYYALLGDERVSCFLMEGLNASESPVAELKNTVKYIDTDKSAEIADGTLGYFGVESWSEIPGILKVPAVGSKRIYRAKTSYGLPSGIKGSFDYFDFSHGVLSGGWYRGVGCSGIHTKYDFTQTRAVRADMAHEGELIHEYELYESLIYTPYLELDVRIDSASEDSLYEISLVLDNASGSTEATGIVRGGERTSVMIRVPAQEQAQNVEYFKIRVRTLYGGNEDGDSATLWLYGIRGHSTEYTSEELTELINAERSKIKQVDESAGSAGEITQIAVIVAILVFTGALGIGLFVIARRGAKGHRDVE